MIMRQLYRLLASDAELGALLGAAGADGKIYPNSAAADARPPYLVYRCAAGQAFIGPLREETAVFEAVSENYSLCGLALARVDELLRAAREDSFPPGGRRIFCALPSGGSDCLDPRGLHVRGAAYRLKYI
ncbi:MAG: hypothetical protein WC421_03500 [Elusimicrobiales bacterium]